MIVTTTDLHSSQRHAEQHLAELLKQRARLDAQYRYEPDPDIRADLDALDLEIAATRRALGDYCTECGSRLNTIDNTNMCCSSPCINYRMPVR
jgi:hypothetical protein